MTRLSSSLFRHPVNLLGSCPPHIAMSVGFGELVLQVLDLRVKMTGVDRGLDEEILRLSELLPESGEFHRSG